MRLPPLNVIATWPKPNYVNPETRGPGMLIVQCIFLPLTVIVIAMRMYVRTIMIKRLWWDDALMIAATIMAAGLTTCVLLATFRYGWDLHVWDLPANKLSPSRQISISGQTLFLFASGITKISILVSYYRIAVSQNFLRSIHISIGIIVAWIITFCIVLWTQCVPIQEYWTLSLTTDRNCVAEGPPLMGQTITTIFTDLLVFLLPIPTLWSVQRPYAQRVGLVSLFALGAFVCVAGIMRTYYTHQVVYETYDVTWEGYPLWIWTALEIDLGIIGGSIPSIKPLFFAGSSARGSRKGRSNGLSYDQVDGQRRSPLPFGSSNNSSGQAHAKEIKKDVTTETIIDTESASDDGAHPMTALPRAASGLSAPNDWSPPREWVSPHPGQPMNDFGARDVWSPLKVDRDEHGLLRNEGRT